MKLERLPSNNCKSAATVPARLQPCPRRTRREYEENTNETRTKYERIPQAPRLLPACKSHAGGFDVAWVWLWVALLHVSAFFLLPSSFAPVWLWGGFGVALGGLRRLLPIFLLSAFCFRLVVALPRPSAFILLPSAFAPCPGTIEPRQTPFAISHTYPTRSIGAASAAFCPRRRCLAGGCPVQPRAYSTSRFFVVFGGIGMAAPEAH
jgi:hypothetical protein